jgi:HD superfamily phosphohydrolase
MLAEVAALHRSSSIVRIPPSQDVPVSERVTRILDSSPFRRLASISQLGMVALVYPGATHSRLEHSLGVYHNALKLLARFSSEESSDSFFTSREAETFLLATLLHDVGHWPFCHPIEDMRLSDLGEHETRLAEFIETSELKQLIASDWSCTADDVTSLLNFDSQRAHSPGAQFFASCLSSPIDVDKLDYLQRDSLHAGVPYGQNFDAGRLITSMCRHPENGKLAINEKGRTAAEMMVFARYVMFSEVYWHHAVRSATAMLQRSVYLMKEKLDWPSTLKMDDRDWIAMLRRSASGSAVEAMVEGLFGPQRQLYKRVAEYSALQSSSPIHDLFSRRPYWWLVSASEKLAALVRRDTGIEVQPSDFLIDAPPVKLEVDINIDVIGRDGSVRSLGEVSPVASALAHRQFDKHVKRVRVFVPGNLRETLAQKVNSDNWNQWLIEVSDEVESEIA